MTDSTLPPDQDDDGLDDIDIGALEHLQSRHLAAGQPRRRLQEDDTALPSIKPDMLESVPPLRQSEGVSVARSSKTQESHAAPVSSDLLTSLRQQASTHHQENARKADSHQALDAGLRAVSDYMIELVRLLNELRPIIKRDYFINDEVSLGNLSWHQGHCDYHTDPNSSAKHYDSVVFSCRFASAGQTLRVSRPGPIAESFRRLLHEYGLIHTFKPEYDDRHNLKAAHFDIRAEVGVNGTWQAEPQDNLILLQTNNLSRLGCQEFRLRPESIDTALLDQFSKLILGEPSRFAEMVRHQNIGPPPLSAQPL